MWRVIVAFDHTHTRARALYLCRSLLDEWSVVAEAFTRNTTRHSQKINIHALRRDFFILFFSLCALSILVSAFWLSYTLRFVFTVQHTQHKHPCPPAGIEPAIPASERQQTYALDRSASVIGQDCGFLNIIFVPWVGQTAGILSLLGNWNDNLSISVHRLYHCSCIIVLVLFSCVIAVLPFL